MASEQELLIRDTARALRAKGMGKAASALIDIIPKMESMDMARHMLSTTIRGTGPGMAPLGDRVWVLLPPRLRARIEP